MELEEVSCYNCGENESSLYDEENGFRLVRCKSCGLLYVNPRPGQDAITAATKTGQHRGDELIEVTGSFDESKISRYLRIIEDFFPSGLSQKQTWLDIGCGHGEFLTALARYFGQSLDAYGCEPNQWKIASAKSRSLNVDFFNLQTHQRQYDFVSALNVFSHLPDPTEILAEWRNLIAPRGYLLLETGHSSHLSARDHHKPYYLPDHLSFANREIVEGILERIGFQIIKTNFYRAPVFPVLKFRNIVNQSIKIVLRRRNHFFQLFPRQPNRDMFVLAQRT